MMEKKNNYVFTFLSIVAWVIFVGLCIEAGALIVNFLYSLFKPQIIQNLYQKLDLSELYTMSKWAYFNMYTFILAISILKAYLFYLVIILISKLDLARPFNSFVSKQITQISYFTLSIGLLSSLAQHTTKNLMHRGFEVDTLDRFWADSEAFILMSAIIYIIATIIKRGIEIQNENDLTV
ncbi:DUF2975 domain-containing protein [Daejeonella sp.]|uniref:DUF2975 domain-containing protein n=1 Tax=Daejeonella sp. TaxID=2805397 RepID=UPI002734D044|nr:DUF2975 domain-containing protein [Daejeonella sp.]